MITVAMIVVAYYNSHWTGDGNYMNFVVIVGVPTIMRFICDNDKSFEMEVDTRHHHHSPFSICRLPFALCCVVVVWFFHFIWFIRHYVVCCTVSAAVTTSGYYLQSMQSVARHDRHQNGEQKKNQMTLPSMGKCHFVKCVIRKRISWFALLHF